MSWGWVGVAVGVLLILGWYLSNTAGRLDRLHHRVETAWESLDAQMVRRRAAAQRLADSGLLDPGSSVIVSDAVLNVRRRDSDRDARAQRESDLTRALRAVLPDRGEVDELIALPGADDLFDELGGAVHRVAMARRFYNDAVRACQDVRHKRVVRWFRLAGKAELPRSFDMDDSIPPGLVGR